MLYNVLPLLINFLFAGVGRILKDAERRSLQLKSYCQANMLIG